MCSSVRQELVVTLYGATALFADPYMVFIAETNMSYMLSTRQQINLDKRYVEMTTRNERATEQPQSTQFEQDI